MPRKKAVNQEKLFVCSIRTRVTQKTFERMQKIRMESDCSSIGEVARKILSQKRINCFYRDISLNAPMEELALIRKELKAIGININQQTKYFHTSQSSAERAFYLMKTAELYKTIDEKVERLLGIISKLAEKWLTKS